MIAVWQFIGAHLHLVTACVLSGDVLLIRAYAAYRRNTLRILSGQVRRSGLSVLPTVAAVPTFRADSN